MSDGHRRARSSIGSPAPVGNLGRERSRTRAAWERFASGDDDVRGVPPPILQSWYRCRDVYKIDPGLPRAPAVRGRSHRLQHCAVFAELGGIAAVIAERSEDCVVTVTDRDGRILACWGRGPTWDRREESCLAPSFGWSEQATGTNGMGTAILQRRQVSVRGPEHWCEALHGWNCTGVSLYDDVSRDPVAALNVSTWGEQVPVLGGAVAAGLDGIRAGLRAQAVQDAVEVSHAFGELDRTSGGALIALDVAGSVIAANERARAFLADLPAGVLLDPAGRWRADSSGLRDTAALWVRAVLADPQWTGTADLGALLTEESREFSVIPVSSRAGPIGFVLDGGGRHRLDRTTDPEVAAPEQRPDPPSRIVALHDGRALLLAPSEIRYAEADRHAVWLTTDMGRMRAATRGIDQIESELAPFGFERVHRSYLVNVGRIREISQPGKGVLTLSTHLSRNEMIPVSRRSAARLRDMFGL